MSESKEKGSLLKNIDVFSRPFNFKINNDNEFTTKAGGVMTILLGVISLVATWYFGKDMYEKKSPSFLIKNDILDSIPNRTLTNSEFFYGLRIEDNSGHDLLDPRKFEYQFHFIQSTYYKSNNSYSFTPHPVAKMNICNNKTHWTDDKSFQKEKLSMYYCADLDGVKVGGEWAHTIFIPRYIIKRCDNETEERLGIKCLKDNEFEMDDIVFVSEKMYIPLVDPKNHSEPLIKQLKYKYRTLNMDQLAIKKLTYLTSEIHTDNHIIFEEVDETHFFEFYEESLDVKPGRNSKNRVFQTDIFLDDITRHYQRIYLKIPDVAANVGGILSIVFYFMKLIFNYYLEAEYHLYLINQLFKLYDDNDKANHIEKQEEMIIDHKIDKETVKDCVLDINDKSHTQHEIANNTKSRIVISDRSSKKILKVESSSRVPNDLNTKTPITEVSKFPKKKSKLFQTNYRDKIRNVKTISMRNQNLVDLKQFKKNHKVHTRVSLCDMFMIITFQPCYKLCLYTNKRKYDLLFIAQEMLYKKLNITNLLRHADHTRLLMKLLLNEHQANMINFRDLKVITYSQYVDDKEHENMDNIEEKMEWYYTNRKVKQQLSIVEYLKTRKNQSQLTNLDKTLYMFLNQEIQEFIRKEVNIDEE